MEEVNGTKCLLLDGVSHIQQGSLTTRTKKYVTLIRPAQQHHVSIDKGKSHKSPPIHEKPKAINSY